MVRERKKIMAFHCLFEQSGTFKNEFKKLGFAAYDYDILNDFNEMDFQIDLFNEIEKAYQGGLLRKTNTILVHKHRTEKQLHIRTTGLLFPQIHRKHTQQS